MAAAAILVGRRQASRPGRLRLTVTPIGSVLTLALAFTTHPLRPPTLSPCRGPRSALRCRLRERRRRRCPFPSSPSWEVILTGSVA